MLEEEKEQMSKTPAPVKKDTKSTSKKTASTVATSKPQSTVTKK
jgi:hypothetical protein